MAQTIDPSWAARDPRAAQAALTRGQWAIFEREFKPREDQAIAESDALRTYENLLKARASGEPFRPPTPLLDFFRRF